MRGVLISVCSLALLFGAACKGGDDSPSSIDAGGIDAPTGIDAPVVNAHLALSRDHADLGMVVVGDTSQPSMFTVSNTGTDPTGVLTVAVTGTGFRAMRDTCTTRTLAAGATCEVTVDVTPAAAGALTGMLRVTATPGGEVTAALTATGLPPGMLMAMPASFDFMMVTAGTMTPSTTIMFKNTGGAQTGVVVITLAGPDAAEFEQTSNGCAAMSIGPGENCAVTVRMRPSAMATGVKTATLSATANPGGVAAANLTGTVIRPAVIEVTGSGAFGGMLVGTSSTKILTVTNVGAQPTGAVTIARTGSSSFQVLAGMAGDCVSTTTILAPTQSCAVRVQYTATNPGAVVGTITASGSPGGSSMVSLTGTGQRPPQLSGDLVTAFGMVEVGTLSTMQSQWTITNTGGQPTSVPMLTIANPELVSAASTCNAAIPAGGTCTITLRFQPSAGGPRSASATVAVVGSMVAATATATGAFKVTLTRNGDAGRVMSIPVGLDCAAPAFSCVGLFAPGNVMLQARTTNGSLVYFGGWSGANAGACAAAPNRDCALTVDAAKAITATFPGINTNLAFLTSTLQPTNLGGTAPYDMVCNDLATAAGINDAGGAAFMAWVSDAGASALSRLGVASGWVRLDGKVVAVDRSSLLTDQRILNPVRFSETGEDLADVPLLTGTRQDGTTAPAATCSNWTSAGGGPTMTIGNGMGGPTLWSAGQSLACSGATYHVLCLMKQSPAGPGAPPTTVGKRLWLTNALYSPDQTGNPDTVCNTDRPAGVAMGKAFITRTTASAASLLTAGTMYVRPDGQEVGTGAEIVAGTARGGIWQSGNNTYWSGQAWSGAATMGDLGTFSSTCGDWTEPTTTGRFTLPGLARSMWNINLSARTCNNIPSTGPRLQCYEP